MTTKEVTFASQDQVELYEATARRFFSEVLDMSSDECLVTDESHLSDFSSCGMPEAVASGAASLQDLYACWETWILGELRLRFGLEYPSTSVPLVVLFRDLEEFWSRRRQ